jgi:DNA-binding CsgD family transcriptional regulator
VWNEAAQRFEGGVSSPVHTASIQAYEAQHQFDDPLAPLLRERRYPTLVTQVVSQRDLVSSAFFDRFLRPGTMYWGLNLYAHDGHEHLGDFRIWRSRTRGNFDASSLEVLRLVYPSLVNALAGAKPAAKTALTTRVVQENQEISAAGLAHQHGLSRRELQVVQRVAEGLSDKEIAKACGIGYTTVRTYLSQALKKTGRANRKELIAYLCARHN